MAPGFTPSRPSSGWHFDNSYARLPRALFARLNPVPVRMPELVAFNRALALRMGLNIRALEGAEGVAVFAGNRVPEGAEPMAQAYAGHQFGYFTLLGDGRAILLGEHVTAGGERLDIQLKGSGRTPFSPPRGRAGSPGPDAPGVHHQRSHSRAGHSNDAQPCGGDHRRAGIA